MTGQTDFPTGNANGMSFICNSWVFTGSQGYRIKPTPAGTFNVYSYAHTSERVVGTFGMGLTESAARELAASLARR